MMRTTASPENKQLALEDKKRCNICGQVKPLSSFQLVQKRWPNSFCIECKSEENKRYRAKDPEGYKQKLRDRYRDNKEHYRDLARRSMYGVPLGTYDMLMRQQAGLCAICGSNDVCTDGRKLALDHDERNGNVRGLLCILCNQGIGQFQHDIRLLKTAILYLQKPSRSPSDLEEMLGDRQQLGRRKRSDAAEKPETIVVSKSVEELGL